MRAALPLMPHPYPAQPFRSWPPAGPRSGPPCLTETGKSGPTKNYDDVEDCQSDLEGSNLDFDIGHSANGKGNYNDH